MKKILVLTTALAFSASSAFAGLSVSIDFINDTGKSLRGDATTASETTTLIGKTSTGVGLGALVVATGGGYAVVTQHKNGTKAFGSSYDSTAIFTTTTDATPGTAVLSVPTATDTTDFVGSDWKTM